MKKFKISPSMLIIVFIIFSLILGLSLYSSYIAQKNAAIEMLKHSSFQLSKTIEKASRNTQIGYRLFLHQFKEKMFADLRYIHHLHKNNHLDKEKLITFVKEESYSDIFFLDTKGTLSLSSDIDPPLFLPKKKKETLLSGKLTTVDFGIIRLPGTTEKRLIVGLHCDQGGAIIGTKRASKVLTVNNIINVDTLLSSITSDSSIKYIVIQNTTTFLNSTTSYPLSQFPTDPLLHKALTEKKLQWRIATFQGEKILETINHAALLGKKNCIIRIGLDYSPIQKIQTDALKQATIRLFILALVGFFMIAYSIVLQNNQLLENEKTRVTAEITDLQKHLTQKEKLSALGELAAGVAHKIRNPLNAISMVIQRLTSEFDVQKNQEEYHKLSAIVKKETQNISGIINQFLQFSRPNKFCKTHCNVSEIIHNVIQLYAIKTKQKNISLIFENPEQRITGYLDDDKIKQTLINLLENAIAATPPEGKITITAQDIEENIIIKISDTGLGIKPENLSKIFNLYFTTKADGTGIGLAQVYRIIAEHDGNIQVDSEPKAGTTFTLTLPKKEEVNG